MAKWYNLFDSVLESWGEKKVREIGKQLVGIWVSHFYPTFIPHQTHKGQGS